MTVKELEEIFETVDNKDMEVSSPCYSEEINGYYFVEKEGKQQLVLTNLNVQPRK